MNDLTVTYRLIDTYSRAYGPTALTPSLAKLFRHEMDDNSIIGLERTDWEHQSGRLKPIRTILIEAEKSRGEWGRSANIVAEPQKVA